MREGIPVSYTHLDVYKRQALGQTTVIHGNWDLTEKREMDGHFSQQAVTFFRKTEKQDAANEGCGEDQKNRGIPADHVACIQKSPGNPVHFHSHLVKYLLKYRQDFYQKDQDHNSHHAKHEQRVSDCRPYLS